MFENFIFYPFSALAVLGALGVITLRKPTYALLSLMGTMFSLAVLFFLLGAPFVAMVHLVVYAGAVLVLFLFVIMLLGLSAQEGRATEGFKKAFLAVSLFVPAAFGGFLIYLASTLGRTPLQPADGSPEAFGKLLFTRYLLPFELVSFLLLIGVFAAVALALERKEKR
ncbi:MAG: NADH-quinone oxidoreductase subunit J [Candidatus Omnitrophica bacterium]|nr:NADH-quinone oxidoreductase subunit J [Candidatus Omnitrophota bacterium]